MNTYIIKTVKTVLIENTYEVLANTEDEALDFWDEDIIDPVLSEETYNGYEQIKSIDIIEE